MAVSHVELGRVLAESGRTGEADAEIRKAVAIAEKLEADFGGKPDYLEDVAVTQGVIGQVLVRFARPADALSIYRLAVAHYQKLVSDGSAVTRHRSWLAVCHRRIGLSLASLGQMREAEAAYREAITHGADGCATWAYLAAAQLALGDMDGYRRKPKASRRYCCGWCVSKLRGNASGLPAGSLHC
jgi:tetratricopeptide (TPR) repeat protein